MQQNNQAYRFTELDIIGFDGRPRAICGLALPVVKWRNRDVFSELAEEGPAEPFSHSQLNALMEDGRMTMLPRPEVAFPNAQVLYITETLLSKLRNGHRSHISFFSDPTFLMDGMRFKSSDIHWQKLECVVDDSRVFAACLTAGFARQLMDHIATCLSETCTSLLRGFLVTNNQNDRLQAEQYAKAARYAARSAQLRSQILVRYAAALNYSNTPERVSNIFRLASVEFPSWTYEDFVTELERLLSTLKRQINFAPSAYSLPEPDVAQRGSLPQDLGTPERSQAILSHFARQNFRKSPAELDEVTYSLIQGSEEDREWFASLIEQETSTRKRTINLLMFLKKARTSPTRSPIAERLYSEIERLRVQETRTTNC